MFGDTGWMQILTKIVWQMNRLALIVTTNLDWQNANDSPNLPAFHLPNIPNIHTISIHAFLGVQAKNEMLVLITVVASDYRMRIARVDR